MPFEVEQAAFTFPGLYAAMGSAYMARYGTDRRHLMQVAVKNHQNGALNPKAQFNVSLADIMEQRRSRARDRGRPVPDWSDELDFLGDDRANPPVAWPLHLFDCSPVTDGASCVILAAEEIAGRLTDSVVSVAASAQASAGPLATWGEDITSIPSARIAARDAYETAGVGPEDIDLAEVHDCFTPAEVIAIEDLGFFEPGKGAFASAEGLTTRDSDRPVNVSGGLKSKGHPGRRHRHGPDPGGVDPASRPRPESGRSTHKDLKLGLTHNVGRHRRDLRGQHTGAKVMTAAGEFTAAAYNRLIAERKIMGSRCGGCGELHVPPRPICSACHGSDMGWAKLSGRGRVTGLTSVAIVPSAMAERGFGRGNPYVTAIVRLDDGPSVAARIEGVDTAALPCGGLGRGGRRGGLPGGGRRRGDAYDAGLQAGLSPGLFTLAPGTVHRT